MGDIEKKKEELISAFHSGFKIAGIIGWIVISLFLLIVLAVFFSKYI